MEAAAGDDGLLGLVVVGDGSGGSGGGGGGAKFCVMVSSSSSRLPLVSAWLACEEASLSFGDSTSGCSLPSSLASSSVVELSRCWLVAVVGGGLPAGALPGAVRADGALPLAARGARDGPEVLCDAVVEGGGIPEVLRPTVVLGGCRLCLGLPAAAPTGLLPAGGVLVLDVEVLEAPLLASCLVGDFAGDRMPLNPLFPAGVGLLAIALPLLPGPSNRLCLFRPSGPGCILLGLALPGTLLPAAFALGLASSSTCRTPAGRRNMPCPWAHWKYRSPLTEPSFFPVASSSSTPTQSPVWKDVVPTNRTVATRPSLSSIFCPAARVAALIVECTTELEESEI